MSAVRPSLGWVLRGAAVALLAACGTLVIHAITAVEGSLPNPLAAVGVRLADLAVAGLVLASGFFINLLIERLRAAHAATRQYREVLEAAADGVVGIDAEGRIAFAGCKMTALLGYASGELIGRPVSAILPRQLPSETVADMKSREVVPGPTGTVREVVGRRKDGSEVALESRTGPPLPPGGPLSATLVLRDVTKSRRIRERLCASEAHLRLVVEQMPAILWTTDTNLRISSTLGAGLAALNVRPAELIGVSMLECLGKEDV